MSQTFTIIFTFRQVLLVLLIIGSCNAAKAVELPLRPIMPSMPKYTVTDSVNNPASPKAEPAQLPSVHTKPKKILLDKKSATQLASYHWLDKAALANPEIIEAITRYRHASAILAKHPRLGDIAEADHNLCHRLTKWRSVAMILSNNAQADRVISIDPNSMYDAIERYPKVIRNLAKNPSFYQILDDNPEIGRVIAKHM